MKNDTGSSSIIVLAIVMFLSTVFLSMVIFIQTSLLVEMEHRKATELRQLLIEEAQEVVKILREDLDERKSDDFFHPVWEYVDTNGNVELKDVGSYLNPNWIDPQVFKHIDKKLLPPPQRVFKNPVQFGFQQLVNYWNEEGIQLDLAEGYKDFFEEDIIENYMTPYTYFNINLCFSYVLKKLCEIRTGSENDGDRLQKAVDEKLLKKKKILDQFGTNGIERWFLTTLQVDPMMLKRMYPLLNAAPVLNVNFAPEEIIRALLSYPDFGVQNPDHVADRIMERREIDKNKKGLTDKDLKTIIGKVSQYPGPRIFHYLGAFTNFWEIIVTIGDAELRWVIARVPPLKNSDDPYYKLIEETIRLKKIEETDEDLLEGEDREETDEESSDIDGADDIEDIDDIDYTDEEDEY